MCYQGKATQRGGGGLLRPDVAVDVTRPLGFYKEAHTSLLE